MLWLTIASIASSELAAQDAPENDDSQQIVLEKNKIDLIDDANLDEAIKRRPDLDFRNVSVDQENSGVQLSTIPSQAVKKAAVLKAATPDLDADTRGGILQVEYKPSYELSDRVVKGRIYNRYKKIYNTIGPMGDITFADRIGESAGFRLTTELQDIDRGSDSMRFDWSESDALSTSAPFLNRIDLLNARRFYDTARLNGSFDYMFSEGNDIYLRFNYDYNRVHGFSSAIQLRYGDESNFDTLTEDSGSTQNGSIRRQGTRWDSETDEYSVTLGGSGKLGPLELDWRIQKWEDSEIEPIRENVRYDRSNTQLGYVGATTAFPEIVLPSDDAPSEYELVSYDSMFLDEQDDETIAAIDFKWADDFLAEQDFLKFGFKHSENSASVFRDTSVFDIVSAEPITLDPFVSGHRRDDFIGLGFSTGALPDAEATGSHLATRNDALVRDELVSALRSDPGSYDADEEIAAAYAMLNWERDNLRIVSGFRFEETTLSASGNEVVVTNSGFDVQNKTASNSYSHFFPGVHLRYRLTPRINLFGSFTKTIKRPDFEDTAPFRIVSTEEREIEEGNPNLQATLFDNWDLALDYKPNDDLLVSWELFHREISDSLFTNLTTVSTGPFTGFQLLQLQNGGSATLRGSKIVAKHNLSSFSPMLEPWSWSVAYTYNDSEASYAQRPGETLPVTREPRNELDFVLTFENEKTFVQLGIESTSQSLASVNVRGPDKDVFQSDFIWFNLKAEHSITKRITAFVDWKNLLKDYEEERHESSLIARPFIYKHDPWAILSGFRFEL